MTKWPLHRLAIMLAAIVFGGAPGLAADGDGASLEALRGQDARVAEIAFRLAVANVALCDTHVALTGLVLHDAAQYEAALRPAAVAQFKLGAGPSLLAVAPGSPAAAAGLQADDALLSVNRQPFPAVAAARKASFDGVAQANTLLDRALATGAATLEIARGGVTRVVTMKPVQGCASEVQLTPSSKYNALADGRYVQVTSAMAGYVANDDELAVVIGHEMAHNILHHRAMLDAAGVPTGLFRKFGANAARVRQTEIEADYLGLYLIARAGYDVAAAPAFWRRFGREHGHGVFADSTHPGWREREMRLQAAITEIAAQRSAGRTPQPVAQFPRK